MIFIVAHFTATSIELIVWCQIIQPTNQPEHS